MRLIAEGVGLTAPVLRAVTSGTCPVFQSERYSHLKGVQGLHQGFYGLLLVE